MRVSENRGGPFLKGGSVSEGVLFYLGYKRGTPVLGIARLRKPATLDLKSTLKPSATTTLNLRPQARQNYTPKSPPTPNGPKPCETLTPTIWRQGSRV